jgi:uncharacterized repeat protein (TIGR02543 family)
MKKLFVLVFLVINIMMLSACADTQSPDELINVIFFVGNTGSSVESYINVEAGTKIDEPEAPVRAGFSFLGWYEDIEKTKLWDFDNDVLGDTTMILYAKWEPLVLDLFFDLNGGTMLTDDYPSSFTAGETFVLPTARRTGFTFIAWFTYDWEDASSTKPGDKGYQNVPTNVSEDLYLYAHWKPIVVTVTFRANYPVEDEGPANPNSISIPYGTLIDFPILEDTNDYVFLGWNTRSDGEGDWYVNGEIFTRSQRLTIYGVWQIK